MEKLSKNFIWMAAANISGSFFGILIFIYLARVLEPLYFGYLSYAMAIALFLSNFVDLGLSTYGSREVAKGGAHRASEYVSKIVSIRIVVAALLYIATVLAVLLCNQPYLIKLIILGCSGIVFSSALSTEWAFQGIEKMHMVFFSLFVTYGFQFFLMTVFVHRPADLIKVPLIYIVSAIPIIVIFLKQFKFKFLREAFNPANLKVYLSSSLVIWSISILAQVYNNLDTILLGALRGAQEVGYFTVARRISGGLVLLLIFLANALLPRLAGTFKRDTVAFKAATVKFLKVAIGLSVFIIMPVFIFGRQIIILTLGSEYLPSVLPLKLMMGGLLLVMFNLPFSTALIAASCERDVLRQVASSACLSVVSNIILIPRYGMAGAAVSFIMAEALALAWVLWLYKEKIVSRNC